MTQYWFNQREATEKAEVSVKTIQRMTAAGKLHKTSTGKYIRSELYLLREEVDQRKLRRCNRNYYNQGK